ncbi:hypothetical protein JQN58_07590 [Aneurinibacillus sp. BA2021]|nr:hypothetical protein [Aneurinibacillus sp. BA2021]
MKKNVWLKWTVGVSSVAAFIGLVGATKAMDENKQTASFDLTALQKNTTQPAEPVYDVRSEDELLAEWREYEKHTQDDDDERSKPNPIAKQLTYKKHIQDDDDDEDEEHEKREKREKNKKNKKHEEEHEHKKEKKRYERSGTVESPRVNMQSDKTRTATSHAS